MEQSIRRPLDIDDVIMEFKKALENKESRMPIVRVAASTESLLAKDNTYYILPPLNSAGDSIQVTLPVIENAQYVSNVIFLTNVTNGDVDFRTPQDSYPIYFQSGFSVNGGVREINALFNGEFWSLTSTKIIAYK